MCCCRVLRTIERLKVGDCSVPRSEGCAPNDMVQTRGASVLFVCVRRVKKVCDYTEMKKNTIREVDNYGGGGMNGVTRVLRLPVGHH